MKNNEPRSCSLEHWANYTPTMPSAQSRFRVAFEPRSIMQVLHTSTLSRFYGCRALLAANQSTMSMNDVAVSRQPSYINIPNFGNNSKIEPQKTFAVHSLNYIQIKK